MRIPAPPSTHPPSHLPSHPHPHTFPSHLTERRRIKEDEYPLITRVMLGPHEDVARVFIVDIQQTDEISPQVCVGLLTHSPFTLTWRMSTTPSSVAFMRSTLREGGRWCASVFHVILKMQKGRGLFAKIVRTGCGCVYLAVL